MSKVKIKITRPIFIDGVTKKEGEIVEVEKNFAIELVSVNAAEYIKEEESKGDELLTILKTKASTLGIKYTKKTTLEELTELVQKKEESIALDVLKAKADELEVAYDEDATVEALTKLIKDTQSKE